MLFWSASPPIIFRCSSVPPWLLFRGAVSSCSVERPQTSCLTLWGVGTNFPSCAHKQGARRYDARAPSVRDGHSHGHLLSSAREAAEGLLDTGANEDVECDASRAGHGQANGSDGRGAGGELRSSCTRRSPAAPRPAQASLDRTLVVQAMRTPPRPWPRMIWWPSALALCAVRWVGLRAVRRPVEAGRADVPWCCKASLMQSGRGQEKVSHAAASSMLSGIFLVLWTIQITGILGSLNRLSSKCQNVGAIFGAWRWACQCWGRAEGRDLACIAHPATQKRAWCTTLLEGGVRVLPGVWASRRG